MATFAFAGIELERLDQIIQRVAVAGGKGSQGVRHHGRILAGETFLNQLGELLHVEVIDFCEQSERVNIFALVAAGPADGLDHEARNGHAHMAVTVLPLRLRCHMIRIIKHDAAELDRLDVVLVAVLVEAEQHVRLITRAQNFARADADLEDGRPAGNGGGNGHEGHDFLLATTRQPGEETADGLDAVLRIAGNADDRLVDLGQLRPAAAGGSCHGCCIAHFRKFLDV